MKILVTFAVDWEFKPWVRLRPFEAVPGCARVFRAQIAANEVAVVLTGVGPLNAARSIRAAMSELPDICIASGLAGGLKRQHRPGEILAARTVRLASSEASGEAVECDERLFNFAVEYGAKAVDQFVSTDQVIRTAKRKYELSASADAVDMESFAILKEMSSRGVPCAVVRAVADAAEMDVPCDFDRALDASGHIRVIKVLGQVVCDPRQAMPLARLGIRSSRAASSLARFMDGYAACLTGRTKKMDLSVQPISR